MRVALDDIVRSLTAYTTSIAQHPTVVIKKSTGQSSFNEQLRLEEQGFIPIIVPESVYLFPSHEDNKLYYKVLATFQAFQKKYAATIHENQLQNLVKNLQKDKKISSKINPSSIYHLTQTSFGHTGFFELFEDQTTIEDCYKICETYRIRCVIEQKIPVLGEELKRLFDDLKTRQIRSKHAFSTFDIKQCSGMELLALHSLSGLTDFTEAKTKSIKTFSRSLPLLKRLANPDAKPFDSLKTATLLYEQNKRKKKTSLSAISDLSTHLNTSEIMANTNPKNIRPLRMPQKTPQDVFEFAEYNYNIKRKIYSFVAVQEREVQEKRGKTISYDNSVFESVVYAFQKIKPEARVVLTKQRSGELNFPKAIQFLIDLQAGIQPDEKVYKKIAKRKRDVAVGILLDLSASTKKFLDPESQILDVMKESVFHLSKGLEILGDSYAIYGYSGIGPYFVDAFKIKGFEESSERMETRLAAVEPQKNNRDGAAIRYITQKLSDYKAKTKIIFHISDGEPKDIPLNASIKKFNKKRRFNQMQILDRHKEFQKIPYQGSYAWEDIGHAVSEATALGIRTYCIRVNDTKSKDLATVYGHNHLVIQNIDELRIKLASYYISVTR